ncbi:nuclease A inhibitor family protein [Nostoc sp. FACHB-145]|uniref:nuclease A inhibitor family protein n=1 Tax=Nostoc sp. FACHB-145 TaxID=2692836 RepID=UPI001F550C4D|nr:nuclease A inhibitor family protein [Nostoc sp. FACHB-145]
MGSEFPENTYLFCTVNGNGARAYGPAMTKTDAEILKQLKRSSDGLLFMSESE